MRNTLLSLILLLLGACSLFAPRALASDAQQASCLVPNGTAVVHYDTGIHGIVGRQEIFEGSDTVYKYENGSLQCYCDPRGVGIQTNWINAKNFNQQQIDTNNQDWMQTQRQNDSNHNRFVQQGIQGNQYYRNSETGELAELPFAGDTGVYTNPNGSTWTSDSMGQYNQIGPRGNLQQMEVYEPQYYDE